jgi:hypothetical protein
LKSAVEMKGEDVDGEYLGAFWKEGKIVDGAVVSELEGAAVTRLILD